MPDTPKKPTQSADPKTPAEKLDELPAKDITNGDAQSVKGGVTQKGREGKW